VIEADDAALLPLWLNGLTWWAERNVQIAIASPSPRHDQFATLLVDALARGVDTIREHQRFLTHVIAEL
jgi:hypothetical protein